jgi:hypothetical protein
MRHDKIDPLITRDLGSFHLVSMLEENLLKIALLGFPREMPPAKRCCKLAQFRQRSSC